MGSPHTAYSSPYAVSMLDGVRSIAHPRLVSHSHKGASEKELRLIVAVRFLDEWHEYESVVIASCSKHLAYSSLGRSEVLSQDKSLEGRLLIRTAKADRFSLGAHTLIKTLVSHLWQLQRLQRDQVATELSGSRGTRKAAACAHWGWEVLSENGSSEAYPSVHRSVVYALTSKQGLCKSFYMTASCRYGGGPNMSSIALSYIKLIGSDLQDVDPRVIFAVTSLASYLFYKRFEPNAVWLHAVLLVAVPALLQSQFVSYTSNTVLRCTLVSTAYWTSLISLTIAYRLSPFHPLAKFPGPLIARITKFWMSYITTRGDGHEYLRGLHARYGDAVRIGPNELSFSRGDLVEPILAMKMFPKGPYYAPRKTETGYQLDGMRDFQAHALRRKPWNKAMSIAAVKDYNVIILNKTQELLESLSQRSGQTLDISAWMSYFGFDFMGQMAFGRDFGMMKSESDVDGLWHLMETAILISATIAHVPWTIPFLTLIPGSDRGLKKMQQFGRDCVAERMKSGSQVKDIFYYLTGEDDAMNTKPSAESVASDGMLAVIAGSDTTATAMSNVWFFMLKHPECLAKLRKEIDATFPDGEETSDFSRHANMPYLNACINEAMRLYPSVLGSLQRRVEIGTGGTMLGDWYVPEDTQISLHHYSLHHDPRAFYPIPDTFWPDRWLDQVQYTLPTGAVIDKSKVITNRSCFLPFSAGPPELCGQSSRDGGDQCM
ncbi:hypothetical protein NM688_g4557 [Phlebia brevispora]|uniref:Uncharacterized protein n=1 Tax=Phlebia brevispora TaxID=194682 RepID=A0ACC1T2M0_9APHY|nr:hypothetical protein NM688_g4557 [Phlebia brevispora]